MSISNELPISDVDEISDELVDEVSYLRLLGFESESERVQYMNDMEYGEGESASLCDEIDDDLDDEAREFYARLDRLQSNPTWGCSPQQRALLDELHEHFDLPPDKHTLPIFRNGGVGFHQSLGETQNTQKWYELFGFASTDDYFTEMFIEEFGYDPEKVNVNKKEKDKEKEKEK